MPLLKKTYRITRINYELKNSSKARFTFFSAMMIGSVFERNGATRGVLDKRSSHERIYEGLTAKLLLSANILMSFPFKS